MLPNKWASRKFWTAIVAQAVGIAALVWGMAVSEQVAQIAGAVITILSALGYLKAESDIDKARAGK